MEDYAEDSIIMTADGARVGIEVIRNFFITMFSALPNSKGANFDYEGAAKFSTAGSFNYGRLAYFAFSSTDSATNLASALNASFSYGGRREACPCLLPKKRHWPHPRSTPP